jgi:predicted site-specific integrase-resolvase
MPIDRVLPLVVVADLLGVREATLRDYRWRWRVRLPLTRVGRRVGVTESDLRALLARGREVLPTQEAVR